MVITCPNCSKRYLAEDTDVSVSGRQVMCASCQHTWYYQPSPGALELDEETISTETKEFSPLNTTKNKGSKKSKLGWACVVLSLLIILTTLYFGRYSVMNLWPETYKLYKVLNVEIPSNFKALKIEGLRPMIEPVANGQKILLTGTLINGGNTAQEIKKITIYVKGDCAQLGWIQRVLHKYIYRKSANSCIIDQWVYEPTETKIYPGERLAFETSSNKPLQGAQSIQVKF